MSLISKDSSGDDATPLPDLLKHCRQVNFTPLRLNKGELSGKALSESVRIRGIG